MKFWLLVPVSKSPIKTCAPWSQRHPASPASRNRKSRIPELQQAQTCSIPYNPPSPTTLVVASSVQTKMLATGSLTIWDDNTHPTVLVLIALIYTETTWPTGKWGPTEVTWGKRDLWKFLPCGHHSHSPSRSFHLPRTFLHFTRQIHFLRTLFASPCRQNLILKCPNRFK